MYDVEDGLIVCFPCLRSPAVVTVDTRLKEMCSVDEPCESNRERSVL